jgi:hypothetical protein
MQTSSLAVGDGLIEKGDVVGIAPFIQYQRIIKSTKFRTKGGCGGRMKKAA